MGKKFLWQNFADSRNLRGEDARVEALGRRQEVTGESSPLAPRGSAQTSRGQDGVATSSEKKAAEKAASQRSSSSSGEKDRCKKGKSCSAACIYYKDDCILELPEAVQKGINQVREILRNDSGLSDEEANKRFMQWTGLDAIEKSNRDLSAKMRREIGKDGELKKAKLSADPEVEKLKANLKERVEYLSRGMEGMKKDFGDKATDKMGEHIQTAFDVLYGKREVMTNVSASAMEKMASKEYQDKFRELTVVYDRMNSGGYKTQEEFSKALEPFASWYRNKDVKDSEVHFMMGLMPPQVLTYLKSAGTTKEATSLGVETPSGGALVSKGKGLGGEAEKRASAFLLMRTAMESGFRDVYTGERLNMLQVDMEHLVPEKVAGAWANTGFNRSLTNPRINRGKSDGSPDYLLKDNPDGWFAVTPPGKGKSAKKEMITFDDDGKMTESGRKLYTYQENLVTQRKELETDIEARTRSPREIMASIASLPPSMLDASEKAKLLGKVVSSWTGASRLVAIGMQSTGRAAQQWYWYGGPQSAGGNPFGAKLASKVAELEAAGNNAGLLKLASILASAQKELNAVNNLEWKGGTVRNTPLSKESGVNSFIADEIKKVRDKYEAEIEGL